MSVTDLFARLLAATEEKDTGEAILSLVTIAQTNMDEVVRVATEMIRSLNFDGNKWSSLAFSLLENFGHKEPAGSILRTLVEVDPENGAYLNNYGVFLQNSGHIGDAIEYFARAYATDYKSQGHEKASTFPAWMNLRQITMNIKLG